MDLFDKYNIVHTFDNYGSVFEYNVRSKLFTNGCIKILRYSFPCYKGKIANNKHNGSMSQDQLDRKTQEYLKKVRTNIIDLAFNYNKWQYFITLTFDDKFFTNNTYSHEEAIILLRKWIDNQKHQNRDFTYLLVAELMSSGKLHFHGLVSNVPKWEFKESRYPLDYKIDSKRGQLIIIKGKQIYNLINYKLGFTTISKIDNIEKVSNYISKYATKDLIKLKNKKRYWYSRNLSKPKLDYYNIDSNLEDYLCKINNNVDYYRKFEKSGCFLEVAQINDF